MIEMPGVNVPTQEDFDALTVIVQGIDARLKIVEANVKVMPDNIKTALKAVLEWMDANV